MKKLILLFLAFLFNIGLSAQDLPDPPCDAKFFDSVQNSIGTDATYIQGMGGTTIKGRLSGGSFPLTLNKGVLYRFTIGNSELSEVDVIVSLYYEFDKKLIKQQKVAPGMIANFEYNCDLTGRYNIRPTYNKKGKNCHAIILSMVKTE
jgi:hypothetical protein